MLTLANVRVGIIDSYTCVAIFTSVYPWVPIIHVNDLWCVYSTNNTVGLILKCVQLTLHLCVWGWALCWNVQVFSVYRSMVSCHIFWYRRYGKKDVYAEMMHLCRHCNALYWEVRTLYTYMYHLHVFSHDIWSSVWTVPISWFNIMILSFYSTIFVFETQNIYFNQLLLARL